MLGPRSPRYPALTAYLQKRQSFALPRSVDRKSVGPVVAILAFFVAASFGPLSTLECLALAAIVLGGFLLFQARKRLPPTAEERLAERAGEVVRKLWPSAVGGRLHRVLHPAVGAILEECAGYDARVALALDGWEASPLRDTARTAARVAMDEALAHTGATLDFVPPPRPLETVSDALEDVGFGPLLRGARPSEPMPPAFRPVRELAERLRELAVQCESVSTVRHGESPEAASAAFRHLDAAIDEMRNRERAEGELRQGA